MGLLASAALLSGQAEGQAAPQPTGPLTAVDVDHHVHLNSPAILAFLPTFCAAVARFGTCDAALTQPLTARELLRQMDGAGVKRAMVLSTAYLAESPMTGPQGAANGPLVASANDFTVDLARSFPRRLGAFISVHPLSDGAIPEIARWKGHPHVAGLKLHLTSSMVDLRAAAHLQRLAQVFGAAAEARLAIAIHLRTADPRYGGEDVRNFVERVVPAARGASIQVAHAGGWGGLDASTLDALAAFARAFEAAPALSRTIWFDLADVWRKDTAEKDRLELVSLIRRIGPSRFLPGSDWPYVRDLKSYYSTTWPTLPLTAMEWRVIRRNVAPWVRG